MTTTKKTLPRISASPRCPACGAVMRLRWRVPEPGSQCHELRQFSCGCGVQLGDKVAREEKAA